MRAPCSAIISLIIETNREGRHGLERARAPSRAAQGAAASARGGRGYGEGDRRRHGGRAPRHRLPACQGPRGGRRHRGGADEAGARRHGEDVRAVAAGGEPLPPGRARPFRRPPPRVDGGDGRYLAGGSADLAADRVFFQPARFWATDEEYDALLARIKEAIGEVLGNAAGEGRRLRTLALVSAPPEGGAGSEEGGR